MPASKRRRSLGLLPLLGALTGVVVVATSCKVVTCKHEGTAKMTSLVKIVGPGSLTAGETRTRAVWYSDGIDCFNSGNTSVHSVSGKPSTFWEKCYRNYAADGSVMISGTCTSNTTNDPPTYVAHEVHAVFHSLGEDQVGNYELTSKVFIHRQDSNMSGRCYLAGQLPPRHRTTCLTAQLQ